MKKVAILGAGISGLALGWYLKKRWGKELDLTLYEKSGRPGGWIRTSREQGFLFEHGPHSCRTRGSGIETLKLSEALCLQEQVIGADPAAHRRFIYRHGALQEVPGSFFSLLLSPWFKEIVKAVWKDLREPVSTFGEESIHAFISRRLGSTIADELFDPLTKGIYAGDPRHLSMQACFPQFTRLEKEHGGLVKGLFKRPRVSQQTLSPFVKKMGKAGMFSFKRGMQTLTDALAEHLAPHIRYHTPMQTLDSAELCAADQIFCALPAAEAARLLPSIPELQSLTCASIGVVHVGYKQPVLKRKGFGYLIPTLEQEDLLGVIWDSSVFPEQNRDKGETRLTVMLPLKKDKDLVALALEGLQRHLGIDVSPAALNMHKAEQAIPQYTIGHLGRIETIESKLPKKITLLGCSYRGVSISDCILEARLLADKF